MRAFLIAGLVLLVASPVTAVLGNAPVVAAPYTAWSQAIAGDTDAFDFGMAIDTLGSAHLATRVLGVGVGYLWPVPGGAAWVREEIHPSGASPDLDIDAEGDPHIVFRQVNTPATIYATKSEVGWVLETVDSTHGGNHCRIRVDDMGRVHIVYAGRGNEGYGLRYAVRESGSWTIEVISTGAISTLGFDLDANGNAHIAYHDGLIRYATNAAGGWQYSTVGSGSWLDLAVDSTGTPHIAFRSTGTLRYAKLVDGVWNIETADPNSPTAEFPSIDTDASDRPHIAYNDGSLAIPFGSKARYATKTAAGSWIRETITPPAGETWGYAEVRVDADGLPRVAYPLVATQIVGTYPLKIVVAQPAIRAVLPYGVLP